MRPAPRQHTRARFLAGCCLLAVLPAAIAAIDPPATPASGSQPEPTPQGEDGAPTEAVVLLRDGRQYEGVLLRVTDTHVVLRLAGIETAFPKSEIARYRVLAPAAERFKALRETVSDDDVDGLLALARWARDRRLWDEALEVLDTALELEPRHPEAVRIRRWILQMKAIRRGTPAATRPPAEPTDPEDRDRVPLLTDEQVNILRVYEIDLSASPRIVIEPETLDAFFAAYASHELIPDDPDARAALARRPPAELLGLMFQLRAREFYARVRVLSDPPSFERFRRHVAGRNGWLINACASDRCHGGTEAGRLRLVKTNANATNALYTNFYILDTYRLDDGTPLINHDAPDRSPLLHMALPEGATRHPHPATPDTTGRGWRPLFTDQDDRGYTRTVEWIRSLYRPRPDYPIEYPPPPEELPDPDKPRTPR